jgi:hypothetical protein
MLTFSTPKERSEHLLIVYNNFRRQGLSRRRIVEALSVICFEYLIILPILSFHVAFPIATGHFCSLAIMGKGTTSGANEIKFWFP